jgi:hypothetical protein
MTGHDQYASEEFAGAVLHEPYTSFERVMENVRPNGDLKPPIMRDLQERGVLDDPYLGGRIGSGSLTSS